MAIDVDSRDMLVLDGNSSEIEGGTAAFKMLPWFRHALASFPGVAYVSRADDDAYLELPLLMGAIETPNRNSSCRGVPARFHPPARFLVARRSCDQAVHQAAGRGGAV